MEEVEVPVYFLCPISMQLMRDPVTTSTGITYDRENIEKWLIKCKHTTCPMTKQELLTIDLTPNHTLRRLIQSWCIMNSSHGVERIPTPKPPITKTHVFKLLQEAMESPEKQLTCLRELRSIAHASESNKKCLESAGIVDFVASIIKKKEVSSDTVSQKNSSGPTLYEMSCHDRPLEFTMASEEALDILFHLNPSHEDIKKFITTDHELFLDSLLHFLRYGNYQSRAYAIMLLKSAFNVATPGQLIGIKQEYFQEILSVLKDKISNQATKAALKLLVELCPWGRNRIKAIEVGAVYTLIDLLLDTTERRSCELILAILHQLCSCAEGRAELLSHGAGIAIVSKKILRVSQVASDRGVRILSSISKFSATYRVLQEMLQVGAVTKLCLVLQVDSSAKTKDRTKKILRLHSRVWRDSSCIPSHLLSSYPS